MCKKKNGSVIGLDASAGQGRMNLLVRNAFFKATVSYVFVNNIGFSLNYQGYIITTYMTYHHNVSPLLSFSKQHPIISFTPTHIELYESG